jgi:hypothetical protein
MLLTAVSTAITVYAMLGNRSPYIVVVTRGRDDLWRSLERGLESWALDRVELIWDRRVDLRRWRPAAPAGERRHGERRGTTDLDAFGFVVTSRVQGQSIPCLRVSL